MKINTAIAKTKRKIGNLMQACGWIFCVTFAAATISFVVDGDIDGIIGGVVLAALSVWAATAGRRMKRKADAVLRSAQNLSETENQPSDTPMVNIDCASCGASYAKPEDVSVLCEYCGSVVK